MSYILNVFVTLSILLQVNVRSDISNNNNNTNSNDSLLTSLTQVENVSSTTEIVPRLIHHDPKWFSESHISPRLRNKESIYYDRFAGNPISKATLQYCQRPAKCQKLNYHTCMGAKLPYFSTTLDLTDLDSQEEVQEKLYLYQGVRNIPKCWAVIQPFLCSLYMPKCEDGAVVLPSKEMCRIILGPCKILHNTTFFPEFMKCEDQRLFPSNCKNDVHELKFNTSGQCLEPLVSTDSTVWSYPDVEGCGLRCKDPLYTDSEHHQIHKLVAWGAGICLLFNAFTVATFMVDWKTANKYPALVIFYINCCFLVSCVGWLAQFYGPDSRDDIVCRKDGTLRMSEPSAGENLSCVIVFVLVYYFLMAGLVWFVILTYAWHMSFQALGKIQERIDKKRAYFHLVAWSFPLILTITTMALGEIDGDSITGICFVGHVNPAARGGLVLGPLIVVLLVGGYFLLRGLLTLIQLKIGSREIISARASSKIRSTIVRMGLFSLLTLVFGITTFVCHIYNFLNEAQWRQSLQQYIMCRLTISPTDTVHCRQDQRPSVSILQLHLLTLFAAGIAMSSWVWTHSTLEAWARFIRRKFDCEVEEPIKLQKHKVIAQAFAKRKVLYQAGRLSISFHNTHTDPVGLNFDLNSVASNDLSSTWAAALPKLVNRRGALTGAATGSVSSQRRNSVDSEISFSVRRVSVESRRNSVDSQLSVQIAELKTTRKVNGAGRRHRSRRRRRDFPSRRLSRTGPLFSRRESSTSLDSQLGAHLLKALALDGPAAQALAPNLKRRAASAGLDGQHVSSLLANGKLVLPVVAPPPTEPSEDENVSLTVSESRFNLVLSGRRPHALDPCPSTDEAGERRGPRRGSRRGARHADRYQPPSDDSASAKRKTSDDGSSLTSFCPELSHLAVQSSLNSAASAGTPQHERHRASKQSKTSIDVGVQANAREIATQTQSSYDVDADADEVRTSRSRSQGTQMSPKGARSGRGSASPARARPTEKVRREKRAYSKAGSRCEREPLTRDRCSDDEHDHRRLLADSPSARITKRRPTYS